ncbi:AfsA-related hotdog domain-containing protein [Kitasatospora sp. NPDC005751]|uniref:AfsA-related hotdog domain-containing protein n=1 Tax=unclassified Kitasatospora TaxID=2633591 RepID=UPI0033CAA358
MAVGSTVRDRGAPGPGAARHLVHCPPSWDHCLLEAPSRGEERFRLIGEVPAADDGPGHFHDPLLVAEAVRETAEFVGRQYFGGPPDRAGWFRRFGLDVTEVAAWRAGRGPARLTAELRATPTAPVDGVPRGLDLRLEVSLDDVPCATGTASLAFDPPGPPRERAGRWAVRAAPGPTGAPADPGSVGLASAADVVLSEPAWDSRGRLDTWVLLRRDHPADGRLPAPSLLEAVRQASVLVAGRAGGLVPGRTLPASCDVRVRGLAEVDPPVHCAAVAGPVGRDTAGRPAVPVTLTLTQHRRTVAEARTTVVQDF